MSRKEDLLFCKIAISTGLVSPEQAQKVLSICDKREKEAGRRPLIGPVFSKYNLLKTQEVQRIYDAVGKRMGTPVGTQRLRPASKKGDRRGVAPVADRRQKPSRPVDPTTLWMGIGGLVVFLGIVCSMIYLVMRSGGEPSKTSSGASSEVASPTGGSGTVPGASAKPPGSVPSKVAEPPKELPRAELPLEIQNQVDSLIGDARSFMSDDPQRGLELLEKMEGQLKSKRYDPPQKLLTAIQEMREAVKQAGTSSDTGSGESGGAKTESAKEAAPPG